MDKETLRKLYPVIIGLGVLVPEICIYFLFFAAAGGGQPAARQTGRAAPADYKGGFNFPKKGDAFTVNGKSIPLQSLRDAAIAANGDRKELVKAINTLGDAKDLYAVPQLLQLLDCQDVYIRGRAGVAIRKILDCDFHYSADLPEEERKTLAAAMRAQAEQILAQMNQTGTARKRTP